MINKINQLKSEADEMGVTPDLLALCRIHDTLQALLMLMAGDNCPCHNCRDEGVDGQLCYDCILCTDQPYPGFYPKGGQ